ncbi:MAG TPA: hypothetical protein PK530_00635 [Anaerolineales bacterium]|nr:hypothetical protein [Anaerolineales bacterium]
MAIRLRLANLGQTSTLDLWSGTLQVRGGGWQTRRNGARVIETFNLVGGGSDATLITAVNTFEDLLDLVEKFHTDPLRNESIWLEANATSETARRALLYDGELTPAMLANLSPLLGRDGAYYTAALTRHAAWEKVTAETASTTNVSALGGTWALGDEGGTLNGRIARLSVEGRSGGGGPLHRFWVGIRPLYEGTSTFASKWECESGTNATDATDTADANASGGTMVRVDFATVATLTKRFHMGVTTFVSTSKHAVGRYLILARAKVTAGTVALQMRSGFSGGENFAPHKMCFLSNTTYELIELGEVQFPPMGYRSLLQNDEMLEQMQLQFWAERISGAGNLDVDCLVLMPSEHMFYVSGDRVQYYVDGNETQLLTFENDEHLAVNMQGIFSGLVPYANLDYAPTRWEYPVGGGLLVFAGQRNGEQILTDAVDMDYSMYPRWRHYAG